MLRMAVYLLKRSTQAVHKKFSAAPRRAIESASYPHSDLTLNVIPHFCGRPPRPLAERPNSAAQRRQSDYASIMCSNGETAAETRDSTADLADQLAAAIEECAAAVRSQDGAATGELAERLAAAWAMLTRADPEIAARMARYSET
jgi:uncharacterized protein YceH (UPF0502 family)